ncbi:hypothetical protein M758_9G008500 [Ceratodon purpureus]|nr:hypothetical protein M758_9G008500 [Ceratodon purpureus]
MSQVFSMAVQPRRAQKCRFAKRSSNSSPSVPVRTFPRRCSILSSSLMRFVLSVLPDEKRFMRCFSACTYAVFWASLPSMNSSLLVAIGPSDPPEDTSVCARFSPITYANKRPMDAELRSAKLQETSKVQGARARSAMELQQRAWRIEAAIKQLCSSPSRRFEAAT